MPPHILILGAGITGLTTALSLRHFSSSPETSKPRITVLELRSAPSTIGGAVNLTPKALRYLDYLGILALFETRGLGAECRAIDLVDLYSGKRYAELSFRGREGRGIGRREGREFFARRVERKEIQGALLEVCGRDEGIEVVFGKTVVGIVEGDGGVELAFQHGESIKGDFLLGCDGIHSVARGLLVEPARKPEYTGVATAMATAPVRGDVPLRWETTALITARRGSLMASYLEPTKQKQYIAAVMQVDGVTDREGWKIRGAAQLGLKKDIEDRFQSAAMPEVGQLIADAQEWTLYPVYALPARGNWISEKGKCLLMGDAAHAMPPQGESTGICIEDGIAFSMTFRKAYQSEGLKGVFEAYESLRREHVEAAYQQAAQRWENVKDCGWFVHSMKMWLTPWILWWTEKAREIDFSGDLIESFNAEEKK